MAYQRTTNLPAGQNPVSRIEFGNILNSYFARHEFSSEITTTPQSIHALIEAQTSGGLPVKRLPYRLRVEFSNPGSIASQPTIYVARCADKSPDTTSPTSDAQMASGEAVEVNAGSLVDFQVWCDTGTCALVFTEIQ